MTNNKELFMKWMKNLFYVQCASLVASLISQLPFIGSWFSWVARLITIATIVILFKLIPLNERYRKAVIFMTVSVVSTLFLSKVGIALFIGGICTWIGTYQEYIGHSELISVADEKLSKQWRSLFNWKIWGALGVALIVTAVALTLSMTGVLEELVAVLIPGMVMDVYYIVLQAVYLVLLKRMLTVYANYELQPETEIVEEV